VPLDEVIVGSGDDVDNRIADRNNVEGGSHARLATRAALQRSTPVAWAGKAVTHLTMTDQPRSIPLSLFALSIFYGGMVCIAGVLGNKQVALGPLAVEAGIFAFLLLVVTSSSVAELHGRPVANRLVLIGFVPLLTSLVLSLVVHQLPASRNMDPTRFSAIQTVLGGTWRIWLGGILAYGISTFLNVTIFSRLKAREGAGLLWLRAGIASVLSQVVDTLIFITVAFYGVFPIGELLLGQMLAKVVLSAILVPPLVYAFVGIGRRLDATNPN